jgi:hypothetical protein
MAIQFKMPFFSKCLNYITIIMLISTPWSFFKIKIYLFIYFGQTNSMSLTIMIYFFLSPKETQLSSNLTNVVDENGF